MSREKGVIIGLDLGTTTIGVAYLDDEGRPQMIRNAEGEFLTPSVVVFPEEGGAVVGRDAKNMLVALPDRCIVKSKRLMGRRTKDGKPVPCACVDGKEYTPEEGAALELKKVIEDAKAFLGEDVEIEAVAISVPAYFKDPQRQATKVAGQIAGLPSTRLVNEPTAAALSYGIGTDGEKTLMVYDVGGGTTDVSILHCSRKKFEVLATRGNTDLGGTDFDGVLMEHILDTFEAEKGIRPDAVEDTAAMQDLKDRVERARETLSNRKKTVISFAARGHQLTVQVTRDQLEEMIGPMVEETMDIAGKAMEDAGLAIDDVDEVIFVGGATRTPLMRRLFKERFGKEPVAARVEPDVMVTLGTALVAGASDIEEGTYALEGGLSRVVMDLTPHPLGVESVDKHGDRTIDVIIPAQHHVPVEKEKTYMLERDLQSVARIKLCQGEQGVPSDSEECEVIGQLVFDKLPRQKVRKPRIKVKFRYNADGIIEAEATDIVSGRSTAGRIEGRGGMSPDEIERAQGDVEGTLMSPEED